MKFINALPICLVLASAFTATIALPIDTAAREPLRKPSPRIGRVPAVARSFELDARDPFSLGGFIKKVASTVAPIVGGILKKKVPTIGKIFGRDDTSDDELMNEIIAAYIAKEVNSDVTTRSTEDSIDDLIHDMVLSNLAKVSTRDYYELDARDPFSIPAPIISAIATHGPQVVKALAPVIKKVVPNVIKSVKKFFGFRRDVLEDLSDDDVAELVANMVGDSFKPAVSRRDDAAEGEAAWNEFVKALEDQLAAQGAQL
jgi:methionyl-tRNA synthetase